MTEKFVFHIRNAHPSDLRAVLATLQAYPKLPTIRDIVEHAEGLGYVIHDRQRLEALITARDLGLVDREVNTLTDAGRSLARIEMDKPHLLADLVHGLQYTLWDEHQESLHCFSWSYRALCLMLWQSGMGELPTRREIASEIEAQARSTFHRQDISFSPKSVGGALLWLSELRPPVLSNDGTRFSRRTFCPPELFVLAVDFVYRTHGVDYGVNLLLTNERRDAICQACLLEPSRFDRVLDYAVAQFDFLKHGIGGGWGRYLMLGQRPTLADIVPERGG